MPAHRKDLFDKRFGRLKVLYSAPDFRPGETQWFCACDCGNVIIRRAKFIPKLKSCGCARTGPMATNSIDLTGQTFGRLSVMCAVPSNAKRRRGTSWLCQCSCPAGNTVVVAGESLKSGFTKSCGCLADESRFKHGMSNSPEFRIWSGMKERCRNPNNPRYKDYGGRGITVCPEWEDSFEQFLVDVGPRPSPEHSLDRLDNDKSYCPENVRWATPKEQARNRRTTILLTMAGRTQTIEEWAEALSVPIERIKGRLRAGWPPELALTAPKNAKPKNIPRNPARTQMNRAHTAVYKAIKDGLLTKSKQCEYPGCDKTEHIQGHHHRGYAEENWLDIVWLCPLHHKRMEAEEVAKASDEVESQIL